MALSKELLVGRRDRRSSGQPPRPATGQGVAARRTVGKTPLVSLLVQMVKFGLVGGVNTALTLAVIFLLSGVARADYRVANASGYAVGLASSFILNRVWTFRSAGNVAVQIAKFLLVFALCYAAQFSLLVLMVGSLRWSSPIAQVLAMAVYTAAGFVLGRVFVYR